MSDPVSAIVVAPDGAQQIGDTLFAIRCFRNVLDVEGTDSVIGQRTSYAIACAALVFVDLFERYADFTGELSDD